MTSGIFLCSRGRPSLGFTREAAQWASKKNAAEFLGGGVHNEVFYRGASSRMPFSSFSWHSMQ